MTNGIDRGPSRCEGHRSISLPEWRSYGVPLLRAPREFVTELHQRHLPQPGTTVVAVLDAGNRVVASASFGVRAQFDDGWDHRNALLGHLRRVTPHDLKRPSPSRTAVLLRCREGGPDWTEQDGAWMWALRAAAELHGLRCGSYLTLTPAGWQSLGDGRRGRNPHSGSWTLGPIHTVTELPPRLPRGASAAAPEAPLPQQPPIAPVTSLSAVRALEGVHEDGRTVRRTAAR
ncbi:hypothetical protein Kpho02_54200 [Kitasatospora phosalacinea]|uniref:Uncharacterized protein n=1 Tax=Kitasatospora phosalacinea TaxID=2065 RepID=A0A9W6QCX5_9ACTN|nr:hypothetical protein Kpho02_54200 [Kitasatospora phosalacinea]